MARILVLTSRLPYPPREGHQLRSWHLLRALAAVHEVTLVSFERRDDTLAECAPLRETVAHLETFPIRNEHSHAAFAGDIAKSVFGTRPFVAEKYFAPQMQRRVAQLMSACDLVQVDMLPLMRLAANGRLPLVLNEQNVEHLLLQQRAGQERNAARRLFLRAQVPKLRRFEREACRRASHVLACSPDDANEFAALAPATPVSVVPNGVDVEICRPGRGVPDPAHLVFVGQMSWFPNLDGMRWFLEEVLPKIVAKRPEVRLTVIGKNAGLDVPPEMKTHVRLAGFVDDLQSEIDTAAVYVVPLRCGSGTRLKVLEAMAFGKAIVTTPIGAQGIDLAGEDEALFAAGADDFAHAVLALLADPQRAARLGAAARAKAERFYDWRVISRDLLAIYDELLRAPAVDRFADELVERRLSLAQR